MSVLNTVKLIIYRVHEKGLEVFLVNNEGTESEKWDMPEGKVKEKLQTTDEDVILLDPIEEEDGRVIKAVAIEGDWHDLPSIRKLVSDDVEFVKSRIKSYLPDMEKGMFFAVKDAFSCVVPRNNVFIKELVEIISEKNLTRNI